MQLFVIATAIAVAASLNVGVALRQQDGFDPMADQDFNQYSPEGSQDNSMIMTAEEGAMPPNFNEGEIPNEPSGSPNPDLPSSNPENPPPFPPENVQPSENFPPPAEYPPEPPSFDNPEMPPPETNQPDQPIPEPIPADTEPIINAPATEPPQAGLPEFNPSPVAETTPATIETTTIRNEPVTVNVQTTTQSSVSVTPSLLNTSNSTTTKKTKPLSRLPMTVPLSDVCLTCMCKLTSKCKLVPNCINGYCGKYHIAYKYWLKAGNKTIGRDPPGSVRAFIHCAEDDSCAQDTIRNYTSTYAEDCNNNGVINCEDYMQIHRLGSNKCKTNLNQSLLRSTQECMSSEYSRLFFQQKEQSKAKSHSKY